jgi:hypothetical protein
MFQFVEPGTVEHRLICIIGGLLGIVANLCFLSTPLGRLVRRLLVPDAFCLHMAVMVSLKIVWINTSQHLAYVKWQWPVIWLKCKSGAGD